MNANEIVRALAERIARKLHGPRLGPSSDAHEEAIFEEAGDIKEELEPVRELLSAVTLYLNEMDNPAPDSVMRSVYRKSMRAALAAIGGEGK